MCQVNRCLWTTSVSDFLGGTTVWGTVWGSFEGALEQGRWSKDVRCNLEEGAPPPSVSYLPTRPKTLLHQLSFSPFCLLPALLPIVLFIFSLECHSHFPLPANVFLTHFQISVLVICVFPNHSNNYLNEI